MKESNLLEFNTMVDKKDLQNFCQALFTRVNELEIEKQQLIDKIAHLEDLLYNAEVVIVGEENGS